MPSRGGTVEDRPHAYIAASVFRLDPGVDEYITASIWSDCEAYTKNSNDCAPVQPDPYASRALSPHPAPHIAVMRVGTNNR